MSTKKLQILGSLGNSDADTLDGKHASEFASASDVAALEGLVGDTKVATQISTAINNIDYPVDSVNGKTGAVQLTASDVGAAASGHNHNDVYYTESEIDSKLSGKSDTGHTHSAYVNQNAFSNVVVGSTTIAADITTDTLTLVAGSNVTLTPDASGDKITIAAKDTTYTHPTSGVTAGTYKSVTVNTQGHVTSGTNPTTLSGYGITDAATKTELKAVSDLVGDTKVSTQIANAIASKSDSTHNHDGAYDTKGAADSALASAKTYADSAATKVKNDLLNGAGTAYDTLKELGDLIDDNQDAIDALETVAASKADASALTSHTGNKSNPHGVTAAQVGAVPTSRTVNGKALSANITLSASDVGADTSGAANTALTNAKAYTDAEITEWVGDKTVSEQISTAIANKSDSDHTHDGRYYTESEIDTKLSGKSDSGHTHSTYVNQNAFSNVKVGSTTIAADSTTDTLTLVAGNNITITPDATNDKLTISATDTVYTHPSYTAKDSGLYKVAVDSTGHVSSTTAVTKADITALGIPSTNTTYSNATQSAAGLMSAADKKTLDTLDTLVGDTSVATQIDEAMDTAITGLSVSGKTITYTKGDGTTGTITTQDTDTKYTHPTTSGNKHIPAGGSSGQILRWSADGTAVWGADNNTTYSAMTGATSSAAGKAGLVPAPAAGKQASFLRGDGTWVVPTNTTYSAATTSKAGLMSAADKTKLDGFGTMFDTFPTEAQVNAMSNGARFTTRGFYDVNDGLGCTYRVSTSAGAYYVPYGSRYICPVGVNADQRDINVDLYGVRRGSADYAARNSTIMTALTANLGHGYTLQFNSGHYYFNAPIVMPMDDSGNGKYVTVKGVCSNAIMNSYDLNQGTYLHFPNLADGQAALDLAGGLVQDLSIIGNPSVCDVTIDFTAITSNADDMVTLVDTGTTYGVRFNTSYGYLVQNVRVQNCTYGIYGPTATASIFNVYMKRCKIGISVGNDVKISNAEFTSVYTGIELRGVLASATNIRGDSIGKHLIECWNGKCLLTNIDGDLCVGSLIHYGGHNSIIHLGQATACMGRVALKKSYARSGSFDLNAVADADYEYCSYISIAPNTQVFAGHIDVVNVSSNSLDGSSDYVHPNAVISIGSGSTVKGLIVKCNIPHDADASYFSKNVIKNLSTYAEPAGDSTTDFDGKTIEDIMFITSLGFVRSRRTTEAPSRSVEFDSVNNTKVSAVTTNYAVPVPTININDGVWQAGYFATNGTESGHTGTYASQSFRNANYIPVEGGRNIALYYEKAEWNKNNAGISWYIVQYDSSKNIIVERQEIPNYMVGNHVTYALNANTAYIRVAFHKWANITTPLTDIKAAIYYAEDAVLEFVEHGYIDKDEYGVVGEKVVLTAPNGTQYMLAVSNTGTLSVTPVNPT